MMSFLYLAGQEPIHWLPELRADSLQYSWTWLLFPMFQCW